MVMTVLNKKFSELTGGDFDVLMQYREKNYALFCNDKTIGYAQNQLPLSWEEFIVLPL